jgi:hypothetical protein
VHPALAGAAWPQPNPRAPPLPAAPRGRVRPGPQGLGLRDQGLTPGRVFLPGRHPVDPVGQVIQGPAGEVAQRRVGRTTASASRAL